MTSSFFHRFLDAGTCCYLHQSYFGSLMLLKTWMLFLSWVLVFCLFGFLLRRGGSLSRTTQYKMLESNCLFGLRTNSFSQDLNLVLESRYHQPENYPTCLQHLERLIFQKFASAGCAHQ